MSEQQRIAEAQLGESERHLRQLPQGARPDRLRLERRAERRDVSDPADGGGWDGDLVGRFGRNQYRLGTRDPRQVDAGSRFSMDGNRA